MGKPTLFDEALHLARRATVSRVPETGAWRCFVRYAGLSVRTSYHATWQLALQDAVGATAR